MHKSKTQNPNPEPKPKRVSIVAKERNEGHLERNLVVEELPMSMTMSMSIHDGVTLMYV